MCSPCWANRRDVLLAHVIKLQGTAPSLVHAVADTVDTNVQGDLMLRARCMTMLIAAGSLSCRDAPKPPPLPVAVFASPEDPVPRECEDAVDSTISRAVRQATCAGKEYRIRECGRSCSVPDERVFDAHLKPLRCSDGVWTNAALTSARRGSCGERANRAVCHAFLDDIWSDEDGRRSLCEAAVVQNRAIRQELLPADLDWASGFAADGHRLLPGRVVTRRAGRIGTMVDLSVPCRETPGSTCRRLLDCTPAVAGMLRAADSGPVPAPPVCQDILAELAATATVGETHAARLASLVAQLLAGGSSAQLLDQGGERDRRALSLRTQMSCELLQPAQGDQSRCGPGRFTKHDKGWAWSGCVLVEGQHTTGDEIFLTLVAGRLEVRRTTLFRCKPFLD